MAETKIKFPVDANVPCKFIKAEFVENTEKGWAAVKLLFKTPVPEGVDVEFENLLISKMVFLPNDEPKKTYKNRSYYFQEELKAVAEVLCADLTGIPEMSDPKSYVKYYVNAVNSSEGLDVYVKTVERGEYVNVGSVMPYVSLTDDMEYQKMYNGKMENE